MIISRTPFRMSFVGGGSDLPSYYRRHGGAVLSTAIDKYVYITVNEKFDQAIRVSYSKTEEVNSVDEIDHQIARESLRSLQISGGIEVTSVADIPSRGTGLGSSSAFTVGLLHALHAYQRKFISAETLARDACEIEIEVCKQPIGKQDQYASAYGGLNFIRFNEDDTVFVDPVITLKETIRCLERNIIVFYTGITRNASPLLRNQGELLGSDLDKQDIMKRMVKLAYDLKGELEKNRLDSFGEILHESWELKKSISDEISSSHLDDLYRKARTSGAIGGKLLGAGAGGFFVFYAPYGKHPAVARSLQGLRQVRFGFERQGSKIIFIH